MFTVKIEPRPAPTFEDTSHVVYDIYVRDGDGSSGEELLLFSHQGYENRAFAVDLAIRLFGSSEVIARHVGVTPVEGRLEEHASLIVLDAHRNQADTLELR